MSHPPEHPKAKPPRPVRTHLVERHMARTPSPAPPEDTDDATLPGELDVVELPRIELRVEREGEPPHRTVFDGSQCRVGSHPSNELVLNDRRVSRFHCVLRRDSGSWRLSDSGSLNGTFLNNIRVRDADLPADLCHLRIGDSCVEVRALPTVNRERVPVRTNFGSLVGGSLPMRRLYSLIERVANSDTTVVIQGESGTGKELIATEIVERSRRAKGPFVVVDCGAIAPHLVESELFGHLRGAFTGADRDRAGAFESADGGTVFLDEVGELPLDLQPKLLRVLESRQVRRLGDSRTRKIDVRVIAATNRNLEREVNRGRFREDLFFRIAVVTIHVPPLRERLEDIPLLIDTMLAIMNATDQRSKFDQAMLADASSHDWPGNVRELRNWVERSVVLQQVAPAPTSQRQDSMTAPSIAVPFKAAKEQIVEAFERDYLIELLRWAEGRVGIAAQKAGIDRMYVYRLMRKHGIRHDGTMET